MKRLLLILIAAFMAFMIAAPPVVAQQPLITPTRIHFAYGNFGSIGSTDPTSSGKMMFQFGLSGCVKDVGQGAVYAAGFGEFGEAGSLLSGNLKSALFLKKPIEKAPYPFLTLGIDLSKIDDLLPADYLRASTGVGIYWNLSNFVSLWGGAEGLWGIGHQRSTFKGAVGVSIPFNFMSPS